MSWALKISITRVKIFVLIGLQFVATGPDRASRRRVPQERDLFMVDWAERSISSSLSTPSIP